MYPEDNIFNIYYNIGKRLPFIVKRIREGMYGCRNKEEFYTSNDKNVLLASWSFSGEGLHILTPYKLKDMEQPLKRENMAPDEMQDLYANVYKYMADKYQEKLGLMPDYKAGHMERLYIISYDSELYYNPNAETLVIDLKKSTDIDDVPELEPRLYKEGGNEFEVMD